MTEDDFAENRKYISTSFKVAQLSTCTPQNSNLFDQLYTCCQFSKQTCRVPEISELYTSTAEVEGQTISQ